MQEEERKLKIAWFLSGLMSSIAGWLSAYILN